MGFKVGAIATVWKVNEKEKYSNIQISTSRKDRNTNEYKTDFSGFVNLVGEAHHKVNQLSEKTRIKILDCEVTNDGYDKEKKAPTPNRFVIWNFELFNINAKTNKAVEDPDSDPFS
jgi:hypothetical protein